MKARFSIQIALVKTTFKGNRVNTEVMKIKRTRQLKNETETKIQFNEISQNIQSKGKVINYNGQ